MKYAKIGGQAVIEGVMMRYGNDYAVTVRKPDGTLEVKKDRYESLVSRLHLTHIPILRGVFAFIDSLVLGISTLTFSASFYDDEESPDKDSQKKGESTGEKVLMGVTVALSVVIAVGLFMILPFFISGLFGRVTESSWLLGIIEGLVRVILFMAYILLISRMKDIQRVFMYHGAEHKSINCIEHGAQLTPENAMKYSRFHRRCGTSFLFIVIFLSIVFFILFFQIFPVEHMILKVIFRILLVPVIAGVAYEVIQWAGRSECRFASVISRPGMALQKLTTREPDLSMIEAAIASIEAIYDWRAFQREELAGDGADSDGQAGAQA
ncbi:uncharacterized protein YqhQ [Catenibacillus scindens]|uniref:Uncharacterized protein YqhQ n=1 Tax=Catenibacillus scindens TaxID=673271 RepID=A0A7W8HDF8_9FIRM|nr:DUF1385 domain-containing protein [Catenibacillus scindens]MBB5265670.1 uncharacterized protein YqhQ [Catenibacillus scindens]